MSFRFSYTNMLSQASRNAAAGIFVTGLLLIGFGLLIWILRELFAILFAVIFCIAGAGCIVTAIKMLWSVRKFNKINNENKSGGIRKNVRIRTEEDYYL
jgi:predicted membrane protein